MFRRFRVDILKNMILLSSILAVLLLAKFTFVNANGKDTGFEGFIVDEKTDSLTSISNPRSTKKSNIILSSSPYNVQPALRGMALSLQPQHAEITKGASLGYKPVAKIENAMKRLHIAPTINLKQTLKTLDGIGKSDSKTGNKKSEDIHPSDLKLTKMEIVNKTLISLSSALNNHTDLNKFENEIKKLNSTSSNNHTTNTTSKKDAQPNVITDSKIKGFLAKDVNFTIDSVGKQQLKDKKDSEQKTQAMLHQNSSSVNKNSFSNSTHMVNSTEKETEPIHHEQSTIISHMNTMQTANNRQNSEKLQKENQKISNTDEPIYPTVTDIPVDKNMSVTNKSTGSEDASSRKLTNSSNVYNPPRLSNATTHKFIKHSPRLHVVDVADFSLLKPKNSSYYKTPTKSLKKDEIVHDECNDKKKCPKNKYCRHYMCYDCHRKHHECVEDDQCCDGIPCVYGRCDAKPKGSPGTICEKDADCGDGCCVIEPTIDEEHGICKTKLAEFHQCSPVLFRKVWIGDDKPKCGPCVGGLECIEKGVIASHLVCMKAKA